MRNWNLIKRLTRGKTWKLILIILFFPSILIAQQNEKDSVIEQATLANCVHYAITHNPDLKNARLNEDITETTIKIKLADWYPQVNFNYNFQHNFQLPSSNFNGNIVSIGSKNTSGLQFGATQNIFNRDVLLASRTAKDVRAFSSQSTKEQSINIAVTISKAFYDLILTQQQLHVTEEDIVRIDQSLKDAYYQYQSGITDKTDYKRATISLNNAKAQKKFGDESVKAKYIYLKELMGYPSLKDFELVYDSTQMANEILLDTLQNVNYLTGLKFSYWKHKKNYNNITCNITSGVFFRKFLHLEIIILTFLTTTFPNYMAKAIPTLMQAFYFQFLFSRGEKDYNR